MSGIEVGERPVETWADVRRTARDDKDGDVLEGGDRGGDATADPRPVILAEFPTFVLSKGAGVPPSQAPVAPSEATEVQLLAETMLRTLRLGGDGRGRYEARLEIGRGAHAGTTVVLREESGRVRAVLSGGGESLEELARRLEQALRERGLPVDEVEVAG